MTPPPISRDAAKKVAPPPNATWYKIPPGTKHSHCSGPDCKAPIYFVNNPKVPGKKLPIDANVIGGERPSESKDTDQADMFSKTGLANVYEGRGVNHLTICPNREHFG